MFQKFKNLPVFIVVVFIVAVLGLFLLSIYFDYYSVKAGTADNISGYAWSDNIGWLSFNNTSDGSAVNYGVNIDIASGYLSGYAWSDNIGWISFNRSDTGNPPAAPFNGGSGPIAKYNAGTRELTGWMRVLANGGGWDGWVRFCDTSIANCSAANGIARIEPNGDWRGWGWSDMVVGWISFNCLDGGNCGSSNYKVTSNLNQPPTASNLQITLPNYCGVNPAYNFSWQYSDPDNQQEKKFQFQIATDSGFNNLVVDRTFDNLANPSPTTNTQAVNIYPSPGPNQLGYNSTQYYWRVRAWDEFGGDSGWVYPSPNSFVTPGNPFPLVDFNWSPSSPSQDEPVQFFDLSSRLSGGTIWSWAFTSGDPAASNEQNPWVKFTSAGQNIPVTLGVTSGGNTCAVTKNINIKFALPNWKEIAP